MVGGGAPREVTEEDLVKRLLGEDWVGASGTKVLERAGGEAWCIWREEVIIWRVEGTEGGKGGGGGSSEVKGLSARSSTRQLSLSHKGEDVAREAVVVSYVKEATGSGGHLEKESPHPGEEGVAAVSEDGVHTVRGGVAAAARACVTEEGASRGDGASEDGLTGKHPREEVQQGAPLRALVRGCLRHCLEGCAGAVCQHGTLRGGEGTLCAEGLEAYLQGDGMLVRDSDRRPGRRRNSEGVREGVHRVGGSEGREVAEAWDGGGGVRVGVLIGGDLTVVIRRKVRGGMRGGVLIGGDLTVVIRGRARGRGGRGGRGAVSVVRGRLRLEGGGLGVIVVTGAGGAL